MTDALSRMATIFVNSCDAFEDCWAPFFTLFDRYWPQHGSVVLNTESVRWTEAPDYVRCSQVALGEPERLTWSDCMIRGLEQIDTPLVLYFQEDYFLDRPVHHDVVLAAAEKMMADSSIGHIALTRHGSLGPHLPCSDPSYETIAPNARYRISTQAGLWRRDVLLSYLDSSENGWMFEILGTIRARRRHDTFLVARHDEAAGGPAIDYTHTGIIKGQWHRAVAALFSRHNISVNFERRGFHTPPARLFAKIAVARKLAERPIHVLRHMLSR
jgi:hypothetical protein